MEPSSDGHASAPPDPRKAADALSHVGDAGSTPTEASARSGLLASPLKDQSAQDLMADDALDIAGSAQNDRSS